VANELGYSFLEKVYENAIAHEFRKFRVAFEQRKGIEVFYDGVNLGNFVADLVVENRVIVELKAAQAIDDTHVAQCLHDLKATGLEVCLRVNSGNNKVDVRRFVLSRGGRSGGMERDVKDLL
jgi:GxxExxY protein